MLDRLISIAGIVLCLLAGVPGNVFGGDTSVFTLSGSKVTDGWVASFEEKTSFKDTVLRCDGYPWDTYYKALLRFDLRAIKASRYAGIKKATLRLSITQAENPKEIKTFISALGTPWNEKAAFSTPDGKAKWPIKEGYPNIEYAALPKDTKTIVITKPGTMDIDITGLVDRWLYQDMPNYGLLISTGGAIHGRPDIGSWKISIAASESGDKGPKLIIEMFGKAPKADSAAKSALRYFPSAFLAPVKSPYIFYWDFGKAPTFPGSVTNAHGGDQPEAQQAGRLTLNWFYGPQDPYIADEQGFVDYYIGAAKTGILGVMVDEWQDPVAGQKPLEPTNPFGITGSIKGILQAKKINPAFFIAVAWRGEENIEGVTKHGEPDLLMIEAYTHLQKIFPKEWALEPNLGGLKKRIDTARKLGMIERTIPWYGMILAESNYHPGERLTPQELERQITEIRAYAPEMPGVAFYENGDQSLADAADRLAYKHFVEPAPAVSIVEPAYQQSISTWHQTITAKAEPKNGRTIIRYRWFIDNRLVAENESNEYVWDVRGETPGLHILTVHAVDSGYNRSAAQIPVFVKKH